MGMGFILFFLQQFYTMNGSWNVINIILNAGASTFGFPPWKEGGKNHSPFRPSAVKFRLTISGGHGPAF